MSKRAFLCLLVLSAFYACAPLSSSNTGFLDRYDGLEPVASNRFHLFSNDAQMDLSSYNKLLIPEIEVLPLHDHPSAYDRELYTQISAYATASYRKMIKRFSSNYQLVDVPQKETLVMYIALSLVSLQETEIEPIAFSKNRQNQALFDTGKVALLVEVKTKDAFSNKTMTRSVQVIDTTPIVSLQERIRFNDLQHSLDAWLERVIKHS